jgi:hypothetical protein
MSVTTPAYPNHMNPASALIRAPSAIITKGGISPVGTAANERSLWRSILDTHGEEILKCASDQFLDLATALRLESINTRDLVGSLAKAGRLAYKSTNVVDGNAVDCLQHRADEGTQTCLVTLPPSKVPDVERDLGSDSSASEPSPADASHGSKRRKKNDDGVLSYKGLRRARLHPRRPGPATLEKRNGNNMRQRECMRMRGQTHTSDMASGKSGVEPPTDVGAVLQAKAPCPRSSTAMKSRHVDFVVISDTEQETSGDDK